MDFVTNFFGWSRQDKVLEEVSLRGIATHIQKLNGKKSIIVMTGAGISTAAGIPDFRTPGTGLYDNLQKYNLPSPKAIFTLSYFRYNPEPFFCLAKELDPSDFKPTLCHYFICLLEEKGLLLRNYTQNVDTLERRAGVTEESLVEAHGTFNSAHCITCGQEYSFEFVKEKIAGPGGLPWCTRKGCARKEEGQVYKGIVKPDVVLFGEGLPQRFTTLSKEDFQKCELLIIIGTSLTVQPFASLHKIVKDDCPRLLINNEKVGEFERGETGLNFGGSAYRDVFLSGSCDDGVMELAKRLGWEKELMDLYTEGHKSLDAATAIEPQPKEEEPMETDQQEKQDKVLEEVSLRGIATHIQKLNGKKSIIVMTGAGISTATGIPDFRTPGTGLYDNLQKYNLPSPKAIFTLSYFRYNPEPFFCLAKELDPSDFKPTLCHYFICLLEEKGLLLRNYTQNVDTLERRAGVTEESLVEAHGTFNSAHCITCGQEYSFEFVKEKIAGPGGLPWCTRKGCARKEEGQDYKGIVKPDVVLFGEGLPRRFTTLSKEDFQKCELLIIIGTSLTVQPFASLHTNVKPDCPRLLINNEKVGEVETSETSLNFDDNAFRDVFFSGSCDDGVMELARELGWEKELMDLCTEGHKSLDAATAIEPQPKEEERTHEAKAERKRKRKGPESGRK